jgi:hypothetical protein
MKEKTSINSYEDFYDYNENGGIVSYPVYVEYQIIEEYITHDSVKVIVLINDFECHDRVLDRMIKDLIEKIKDETNQSFADKHIEVITIDGKNLRKIAEYTFEK